MREPVRLPPEAQRLCDELKAPVRLVAHLRIVCDVAHQIMTGLQERFPGLVLNRDEVAFGAATHDLGKVHHPGELTGPGRQHEKDGPALLEAHGVPSELARFARTHGDWKDSSSLEDLLVASADSVWKGQRDESIDALVVQRIAEQTNQEPWEVFSLLDDLLAEIAVGGQARLAWQAGQ